MDVPMSMSTSSGLQAHAPASAPSHARMPLQHEQEHEQLQHPEHPATTPMRMPPRGLTTCVGVVYVLVPRDARFPQTCVAYATLAAASRALGEIGAQSTFFPELLHVEVLRVYGHAEDVVFQSEHTSLSSLRDRLDHVVSDAAHMAALTAANTAANASVSGGLSGGMGSSSSSSSTSRSGLQTHPCATRSHESAVDRRRALPPDAPPDARSSVDPFADFSIQRALRMPLN